MRDATDLGSLFRTNFNAVPEFRNIFKLVLIRLPEDTLKKLLALTEDTLFLVQQAPYASIQRIFITPPPPKPLTLVMFSQRVTQEMSPMAQAGAIIHELCHILCAHKQFTFFDKNEPQPEYQRPVVIVEGEGEKTDLRVVLGKNLSEQEEGQANGLAITLGFKEELSAAFRFIERRGL
jgi:hypothetical protein